MNDISIGVLAVQGAFIEHAAMLRALGADVFEIRQAGDLQEHRMDGLVLPGGESTVQGKLLKELGLFDALQERIRSGMPVLATCAGAILLAGEISNDENRYFASLPVLIRRNAYGRQLGSFVVDAEIKNIGDFRMHFIRAPYFEKILSNEVQVLSEVDGHIVAVEYQNQLAFAFHPEVGEDRRLHRYFLEKVIRGGYQGG